MTAAWTSDELDRVAAAEGSDHLGRPPRRRPVRPLLARPGSTWFRGVQARHEGHIRADGVDKDVLFVETDEVSDSVDAAYLSKYNRYGARYVDPMVAPEAQAATLRLVPHPDS